MIFLLYRLLIFMKIDWIYFYSQIIYLSFPFVDLKLQQIFIINFNEIKKKWGKLEIIKRSKFEFL